MTVAAPARGVFDAAPATPEAELEPRVHDNIASVTYLRSEAVTICVIALRNGFYVGGRAMSLSSDRDGGARDARAYRDAVARLPSLGAYARLDRAVA